MDWPIARWASFCSMPPPVGPPFSIETCPWQSEWLTDPVRCREAGIPEHQALIPKGELARRMLARAFAAQVPAAWVVGDTRLRLRRVAGLAGGPAPA
jgi:hypothetical protein